MNGVLCPERAMKLIDLVQPNAIITELEGTDRNTVIRELVAVLAAGGWLAAEVAEAAVKSIIARERSRGTTGFGKGVALPHAKIDGLAQIVAAVGRSSRGVAFESHDGLPVFGVFLVLSPATPSASEDHLKAMELVYRHLQQDRFRKFLRQSDTREKIYDLLREADEKPLVA
jgi:mannitol/fructose-specific phosphotransferase system IIA component (Ntr-type)